MSRVRSFQPIEDKNAKVLILGSMPGRASLAAGQYYAHGQNAFWRVISELLRLDAVTPYERKVQALKAARIAVWDVLRSCTREGSLDARIERDSQVANDFRSFFRAHPGITRVFFNGAMAEACFKRHVLQNVDDDSISYVRLPSTSPAHASLSFEQKLKAWRIIMAASQTRR
ncbi:MAG: DNA-deoxyinosine glycosylase [Betaproteobacteria bacterium RIFCSPLOWO2_02_FULL_62_17]|nr:MAG: DNA-deoxyinosine glycosylase [Betaproteobacteria bacterium RIFCSPLOWO2_02_FULL_62_17]